MAGAEGLDEDPTTPMRLGFIGLGKHLAEECGLDIEALGKVVRHSDAVMLRKTTAVVDAGLEAGRRRSRCSASWTDADGILTMSPPQKVIRC